MESVDKEFTLIDFQKTYREIRKLAKINKFLSYIPGMSGFKIEFLTPELERDMKCCSTMIDSMTPSERADVRLIDRTRESRIAAGSGMKLTQVSEFISRFKVMARTTNSRNESKN